MISISFVGNIRIAGKLGRDSVWIGKGICFWIGGVINISTGVISIGTGELWVGRIAGAILC